MGVVWYIQKPLEKGSAETYGLWRGLVAAINLFWPVMWTGQGVWCLFQEFHPFLTHWQDFQLLDIFSEFCPKGGRFISTRVLSFK